jgi:hypothetical protein
MNVIGLDDVVRLDPDLFEPSTLSPEFEWRESSNVSSFPLGHLQFARSEARALLGDRLLSSFDFKGPADPLADFDTSAAWASTRSFMESRGEDVASLLLRAEQRIEGWQRLKGVRHLLGGEFGTDEVRKLKN